MAEAASEVQWMHTSVLQATIINSNPFRSGKAVSASELNPHYAKHNQKLANTIKGSDIAVMFGGSR